VIPWAFPDFEFGKFIPLRKIAGLSLFEVNEPDDTLITEITRNTHRDEVAQAICS
jgi:hypothetical protein